MTSINPHYTFNYSQPEDYHFSHDSVFLARKAFDLLKKENMTSWRVLDLCSGCGIIGLDFLFHCQSEAVDLPEKFDFIEIQEIYRPHFEKNKVTLGPLSTTLQFLNMNYNELTQVEHSNLYDLVLCNPPYFIPSQGKLSPSNFKNRCRFYLDSDFQSLLRGLENALAPEGKAFILMRNLEDHGLNYFEEAQRVLSASLKLECIGDIRGTGLAQLTKLKI